MGKVVQLPTQNQEERTTWVDYLKEVMDDMGEDGMTTSVCFNKATGQVLVVSNCFDGEFRYRCISMLELAKVMMAAEVFNHVD